MNSIINRLNKASALLITLTAVAVLIAMAQQQTTRLPSEILRVLMKTAPHLLETDLSLPKTERFVAVTQRGSSPAMTPVHIALAMRTELASIPEPISPLATPVLTALTSALDEIASTAAVHGTKGLTFAQLETLATPKIKLPWLNNVSLSLPIAQWVLLISTLASYVFLWSTLATLQQLSGNAPASLDDVRGQLFFGAGRVSFVVGLALICVPAIATITAGPTPWSFLAILPLGLVWPWWRAKRSLVEGPPSVNRPTLVPTDLSYPNIEFSLTNGTNAAIHISHVRCVRLATLVHDDLTTHNLVGPKVVFEFDVRGNDPRPNILADAQCDLYPEQSQAFRVAVLAEKAVALVGIEIKSTDPIQAVASSWMGGTVFYVVAPVEVGGPGGIVQALGRAEALAALDAPGTQLLDLAGNAVQGGWRLVLLRGIAGLLSRDRAAETLRAVIDANPDFCGPILSSVVEQAPHIPYLQPLLAVAESHVSDPECLFRLGAWDQEVFAENIVTALLKRVTQEEQLNYALEHADRVIRLPRLPSVAVRVTDEETIDQARMSAYRFARARWLQTIAREVGIACVEYLVMNVCLVPANDREAEELIRTLLADKSLPEIGPKRGERWQKWWAGHTVEAYRSFDWRSLSPRLNAASMFMEKNVAAKTIESAAASSDPFLRFWAAQCPLTASLADVLSADNEIWVRYHVAHNPSTSEEAIGVLASDDHADIRFAAAAHANQSKPVLEQLCEDADREVAAVARQRLDRD